MNVEAQIRYNCNTTRRETRASPLNRSERRKLTVYYLGDEVRRWKRYTIGGSYEFAVSLNVEDGLEREGERERK